MKKGSDICIIIQGPTTFYNEIINAYNGVQDVYWATWNDEPIEHVLKIKESSIDLLLLDKPSCRGYHNVNLQCYSVYALIEYASKKVDYKTYLKVRSDLIITPLSLFIENAAKANEKFSLCFIGLKREENTGRKYLLDYIVAGNYHRMSEFWRPLGETETGLPYPEKFLERRNLSFAEKFRLFVLKLGYVDTASIDIYSLKWNNSINNIFSSIVFISAYSNSRFNLLLSCKCWLFDNILSRYFFFRLFRRRYSKFIKGNDNLSSFLKDV